MQNGPVSKDEWNSAANRFAQLPTPETEADFATLRTLGRTIVGRSFPFQFGRSNDIGQAARTIWQVISENADRQTNHGDEGEEVEIHQSPGGRVQVKARVVRDQGRVVEIRFEKTHSSPDF